MWGGGRGGEVACPLERREECECVLSVAPCALFWLPAVEQLLSQPAGQRLAHLIQQLGQLDVVFAVVLSQEAA